jgi:secreted trypsin-like serine protease
MWVMRRRIRLALIAVTASAMMVLASGSALGADVEPKVVGGTAASIDTYPWQGAVLFSTAQKPGKNAQQRMFCAGSLVTPNVVMTAAHCVYDTDPDCSSSLTCQLFDANGDLTVRIDPNDVSVLLGHTTLTGTGYEAEHAVADVAYQGDDGETPAYNPNTMQNDVAYLTLSSPSALTPIHLAGSDEEELWDPGSLVEVSGWGTTSESSINVSNQLMAATVPITTDSSCVSAYSSIGWFVDPSTMVCAGYPAGGVDTCAGDSGGPMQAPLLAGGYRLVGQTSWGKGCAEAGFPGVYTRVAEPALRNAIAAKVAGLDPDAGSIVGSGGVPKSGNLNEPPPPAAGGEPPAATTVSSTPTDPFAKCKRIHDKKKRKRCTRKVRARLNATA